MPHDRIGIPDIDLLRPADLPGLAVVVAVVGIAPHEARVGVVVTGRNPLIAEPSHQHRLAVARVRRGHHVAIDRQHQPSRHRPDDGVVHGLDTERLRRADPHRLLPGRAAILTAPEFQVLVRVRGVRGQIGRATDVTDATAGKPDQLRAAAGKALPGNIETVPRRRPGDALIPRSGKLPGWPGDQDVAAR